MKAYRSLKDFRMKSSFATWLYRIVYNTAVSLVRSRKRNILSLEEFPADAVDFMSMGKNEEESGLEYRNSLVNFALQNIPEEDRGLITLFYYEELDAAEISRITGISRNNIKVRLFRARQKMAGIIRKAEMKNIYSNDKAGIK